MRAEALDKTGEAFISDNNIRAYLLINFMAVPYALL